jgi:3-methylcrotonyl-CoA carboxylase alpha subunit
VKSVGAFYFMEMNTRLQVEHPVTEMITGLDLVDWQLRVASGEHLPLQQERLAIKGHAIEARIYAENPEKGFLPSIGTLRHVCTPVAVEFDVGGVRVSLPPTRLSPSKGEGENGAASGGIVRIDSGVREGDAISPFYDPMIAKLIVWGQTRDAALAHMARALSEYQVVGVANNIAFLKRLIQSKPFASAELDTGLIERHQQELFPAAGPAPLQALALAAAALLDSEQNKPAGVNDPWSDSSGWRMNSVFRRKIDFADEQHAYPLVVEYRGAGRTIVLGSSSKALSLLEQHGKDAVILLDSESVHGTVVREADAFHVFAGGMQWTLAYADPLAHAGEAEAEGGRLTAPMPGKIVALMVGKGDTVEKGAPLLIM